jgi:hypothetical protein
MQPTEPRWPGGRGGARIPIMTLAHGLSKSTFLRGLQCQKSLYLHTFQRELGSAPDEDQLARMKTGQLVGELARGLFPAGVLVSTPGGFSVAEALRQTRQALESGANTLFEPAFLADGLFFRADVVDRAGGAWKLYEVKSSTSVKDEYLLDVGFQVYVMQEAGLEVDRVWLVHIDSSYVRQGVLDVEALFAREEITDQIGDLLPSIPTLIDDLRSVLAANIVPDIPIGHQCWDPFPCDFIRYCWENFPSPSIFDVYRLPWAKKEALRDMGILAIEDIPDDFSLPAPSRFHVVAHKAGQSIIKREPLRRFIEGLRYPLACLDFETAMSAIPAFDGSRPYQQIPFQFSVHVLESARAEPIHHGFLAEPGGDPRPNLMDHLRDALPHEGDVLVYYQPFEQTRLAELARDFPAQAEWLEAVIARLKDLILPFQQRWVYEPSMNGSSSIKAVLPALVPEMSYEGMAVADGTQAMLAWERLSQEPDPVEAERVRRALWDYCTLDTLAMVRILERLEELARP